MDLQEEGEPAQVQVNIYESDDEDSHTKGSSWNNSRSPVTRSLVEPEKENANTSSTDIEMQKIDPAKPTGSSNQSNTWLTKQTSNLPFYQLEERCLHFERTSAQYEQLYGEYLEKFILTNREKEVLLHKTRRVNCLIANTASTMARWDGLSIEQRKNVLGGLLVTGCLLLFVKVVGG